MRAKKFYFEVGNEENCYPLDYFKDRISDGEKEIQLELAKRDYKSGFMWCSVNGDFVETGDGSCGKHCIDYRPRNKKSGRCRKLDNTFTATGKILTLTKDGFKKL